MNYSLVQGFWLLRCLNISGISVVAPVTKVDQSLAPAFKGQHSEVIIELSGEAAESQTPIPMQLPVKPSLEEQFKHEATHLPFRSWCDVCVESRAKESPHFRNTQPTNVEKIAVVQWDFWLLERLH